MRCVIDTNGLVRCVPNNGNYRWLYKAWQKKKFVWVFSNEILTEYHEVIGREYSETAAKLVTDILLASHNHLRIEQPSFKWQLVEADPDDNKFVDCTIASSADYLVSDDTDILNLGKIKGLFPPISIIDFEEFRKILKV